MKLTQHIYVKYFLRIVKCFVQTRKIKIQIILKHVFILIHSNKYRLKKLYWLLILSMKTKGIHSVSILINLIFIQQMYPCTFIVALRNNIFAYIILRNIFLQGWNTFSYPTSYTLVWVLFIYFVHFLLLSI